jgi:hypothetical protein
VLLGVWACLCVRGCGCEGVHLSVGVGFLCVWYHGVSVGARPEEVHGLQYYNMVPKIIWCSKKKKTKITKKLNN